LTNIVFVYNNKGNSELAINKNIEALKTFESINEFAALDRTFKLLEEFLKTNKNIQKQ
jgi:hypothetical protein